MAKQISLAKKFSGLPLEGLIGGPLVAIARANSMMALEQVKFIINYCFTEDKDGHHHPRMINMTLTRSFYDKDSEGKDGLPLKQITSTFSLPLITIIPISSLAVERMKLDFEMDVKTQYTHESSSSSNQVSGDIDPNKKSSFFSFLPNKKRREAVISGVVSTRSGKGNVGEDKEHYDKSSSSKLMVSVDVGNLPLPVGLKSIIDLFSKTIEPSEVKQKSN